jgi:hypothetical protein
VTSEPEHQTSPLADGNGTTTATSGSELAKNTSIPHHAEKEKSARQQEKRKHKTVNRRRYQKLKLIAHWLATYSFPFVVLTSST